MAGQGSTPRSSASSAAGDAQPRKKSWNCWKRYKEWSEVRKEYLANMYDLVLVIEEEEDYDWDDLDEEGNPRPRRLLVPYFVRRAYRMAILVYWDPLVDLFYSLPSCASAIKMFFFFVPLMTFLACVGWLGYSGWRNMQYSKGDCEVEIRPVEFELPEEFANKNPPLVRGTYTIKRSFGPSVERPEGYVLQTCEVLVPCHQLDYGQSQGLEDDRCVDFESWNWADRITCFYYSSDLFGLNQERLYCLKKPSDLDRELFAVLITSLGFVFSVSIAGIFRWRQLDVARQDQVAAEAVARREEEEAEAKRKIANRADEEAKLYGKKQEESEAATVNLEGLP